MDVWQFCPSYDVWEYHSSKYMVFEYHPGMIKTVLEIYKLGYEAREAIKRVSVIEDTALLRLSRRQNGEIIPSRRRYITMTDDEVAEAFALAETHDLFTLSDAGIYEVGIE